MTLRGSCCRAFVLNRAFPFSLHRRRFCRPVSNLLQTLTFCVMRHVFLKPPWILLYSQNISFLRIGVFSCIQRSLCWFVRYRNPNVKRCRRRDPGCPWFCWNAAVPDPGCFSSLSRRLLSHSPSLGLRCNYTNDLALVPLSFPLPSPITACLNNLRAKFNNH